MTPDSRPSRGASSAESVLQASEAARLGHPGAGCESPRGAKNEANSCGCDTGKICDGHRGCGTLDSTATRFKSIALSRRQARRWGSLCRHIERMLLQSSGPNDEWTVNARAGKCVPAALPFLSSKHRKQHRVVRLNYSRDGCFDSVVRRPLNALLFRGS